MLGIKVRVECPSCGNIIIYNDVIIEKGSSYCFKKNTECGCGRKTNFKLINFTPMDVGMADREKEELLAIPNDLQNDMKQFMINKIKEREQTKTEEKEDEN
jgi:hypothetical protein